MISPEELKIAARKVEPSSKTFFKKNVKKLMKADNLVLDLHNRIVGQINCLECANCCRSLGPRITNKDIDKLARLLRLKPSDFIDRYLRIDEDNDFVFSAMPCPFLQVDNYCSVYSERPKACREYPHTDRPKFYRIVNLTIKNTYTCPVAYEVIEVLKKEL